MSTFNRWWSAQSNRDADAKEFARRVWQAKDAELADLREQLAGKEARIAKMLKVMEAVEKFIGSDIRGPIAIATLEAAYNEWSKET